MRFSNKAVKAVIVSEGTILLLKRRKQEKDQENWDLPGGLMEMDETEENALFREILEETGLHMKQKGEYIGKWHFLRPKDETLVEVETYMFNLGNEKPDIQISFEHSEFKWVAIQNIRNYPVKDPSFYELLENTDVKSMPKNLV